MCIRDSATEMLVNRFNIPVALQARPTLRNLTHKHRDYCAQKTIARHRYSDRKLLDAR